MMSFNPQHTFLSSSHKRFYYHKFQQLYTEALAGTVVNSSDPMLRKANSNWLMNDDKNQHEICWWWMTFVKDGKIIVKKLMFPQLILFFYVKSSICVVLFISRYGMPVIAIVYIIYSQPLRLLVCRENSQIFFTAK
ncbi:MAG: chorismate-binding protein [Arsenophonus sp. NEOnobi-MAG3]